MRFMEGFPTLALCALAALTLGCGEKEGEHTGHEHSGDDTGTDDSGSTDDSGTTDDSSTTDDSGIETQSYATDVEPILTSNCSPCHTSSASGGLSLAQGSGYGNLVSVAASNADMNRVTPNDPPNSYLWRKLEGTQGDVSNGGGDQMPKGGTPLNQQQMGVIDQWIRTGANP